MNWKFIAISAIIIFTLVVGIFGFTTMIDALKWLKNDYVKKQVVIETIAKVKPIVKADTSKVYWRRISPMNSDGVYYCEFMGNKFVVSAQGYIIQVQDMGE